MIAFQNRECLGKYNFENIAHFAKKRFIEGCDTIELLKQAKSESEKEEIALVCLLDVEDEQIVALELNCKHASECRITDCRDRLRKLIAAGIADD